MPHAAPPFPHVASIRFQAVRRLWAMRRIPPHPRSRPDAAHAIDRATSASRVAPVHRIVPRPNSVSRQVRPSAANPGIRQRHARWARDSTPVKPPSPSAVTPRDEERSRLDKRVAIATSAKLSRRMTSRRPSMHPLDKTMRTLSS
ncbi:hypothetical protein OsJ_36651 [Oryza sativa Japonica Group]|uniref:Uncharacterized protein n=3 Tax=Oryza TaxID=4527 RepID=A0A8J8Y742_ORYSJ|nr:hypothetical protein LOC_Os12g39000 [Oryza sativa Japonica Group]EAZ21000.1 hypothetical protein OsJ_36651 [Oryza sativa Japonica Group]